MRNKIRKDKLFHNIIDTLMNLRHYLVFSLTVVFMTAELNAQDVIKYRRSSLHTIIVESDKFPQKETILNAFNTAPFPDKYNDHSINEKVLDPGKYPLSYVEKTGLEIPKNGDTLKSMLPLIIEKYLRETKVANKLVAKWFNRQEDGSFDMNLIGERGSYNASEMEVQIAKGSARGKSSLKDAGIELISNTFVVVSKYKFVSNELAAATTRDIAKETASRINIPIAQAAAIKTADALYNKAKDGYSVYTTSYLYKLLWNDSIEAIFYNDLWMENTNPDKQRKEAFNKTDLFKLEFVGDEEATGLVLFSSKTKKTEEQIITVATIRTIDAVYAKLQKTYDVFKPKVPLFTGDPITAKIGMKEGLEGGEDFDVLEQVLDPVTGLTHYVNKGRISVDRKKIWDNRYNAEEEQLEEGAKPAVNMTYFNGGKKYYEGMLIKQVR